MQYSGRKEMPISIGKLYIGVGEKFSFGIKEGKV